MKITFVLLLVLLTGCSEEEPYDFQEAISPELMIYFESFAQEAVKRGVMIEWSDEHIYADIVNVEDEAVGQCLTYEQGKNQVNIDRQYWQSSNGLQREFLIFHELGHCILKRSHLDLANFDGTCMSVMSSGQGVCRRNYTTATRKSYLDELFS